MSTDLFGECHSSKGSLKDRYGIPPFSIISSREHDWQERKRKWLSLGIVGERTREAAKTKMRFFNKWAMDNVENSQSFPNEVSVFDPVLCEQMYKWYCPIGGTILDPFAGGSVRGIVANYLGYNYTGIDIRKEQVDDNIEQARKIIPGNLPEWIVGDSSIVLDSIDKKFDLLFTCPPYFNLEVYSEIEGDLSNMNRKDFFEAYRNIIKKSTQKLKKGGMAIIVVGEVRLRSGYFVGLVPETINSFVDCGLKYYNEAILSTPTATAQLRASSSMKYGKLVKVHQNVLMFKKTTNNPTCKY